MSQQFEVQSPASEQDRFEQEFIFQQQELIAVLKQEIIRLQEQLHTRLNHEVQLKQELSKADDTIYFLNEKITNISENNESLLRTVNVFQRQFIRREGGALSKLEVEKKGNVGPFHLEIIRNLKSKLSNVMIEPSSKHTERSVFSEYYGFFLQDDSVEESEVSLYNEIVENSKQIRSSKVRSLGKKQYFHQKFRHVLWFRSIENKQRITERLYSTLLDLHEGASENQRPKKSIIDLDLRRMDLRLDDENSKEVSREVKRLLELFELYRPDIKYVQGMSYLAWIFIIRMNPCQAFSCFCNLILSDSFVFSLYIFDETRIKSIVLFFGECLKDKRPKLHRHMLDLAVDTELFLIEWAYTLYSRAFSLRIISKIWDLWFSEGYNTFFKVAMTVLELLEPELMDKNENDKFIDTVRTSTFKIEEAEFLRVLGKQRLFEDLKLE